MIHESNHRQKIHFRSRVGLFLPTDIRAARDDLLACMYASGSKLSNIRQNRGSNKILESKFIMPMLVNMSL